jgi:transposase-like protein
VNKCNGRRPRDWDTLVRTVEVAIPKLRSGSCFPTFSWNGNGPAEAALISVAASGYLPDLSARRMDLLVHLLGTTTPSKSPMAGWLRRLTRRWRRFLSGGWTPGTYTFGAANAQLKVREDGRNVNRPTLLAVA